MHQTWIQYIPAKFSWCCSGCIDRWWQLNFCCCMGQFNQITTPSQCRVGLLQGLDINETTSINIIEMNSGNYIFNILHNKYFKTIWLKINFEKQQLKKRQLVPFNWQSQFGGLYLSVTGELNLVLVGGGLSQGWRLDLRVLWAGCYQIILLLTGVVRWGFLLLFLVIHLVARLLYIRMMPEGCWEETLLGM